MENKNVKDLSFKPNEMIDFLNDCIVAWGKKIESMPIMNERYNWVVDMNTRATILKVKLQVLINEQNKKEEE